MRAERAVTIPEAIKLVGLEGPSEIYDAIRKGKIMVARGRVNRSTTKLDPRSFRLFCVDAFVVGGVDRPTSGGTPSRRKRRKVHGKWR